MPTSNTRPLQRTRFHDSLTGVTGSTNGSVRTWKYFIGQKLTASDPRGLPLTYSGRNVSSGAVLRPASPPISGYIPTPLDGTTNRLIDVCYAGTDPSQVTLARNRSWDKMLDKVRGDTSALGTAALEGRETFEMVANRVTGLYRAYKALRKGDFRRFLRELSCDPKRKHRSTVRTASNEASGIWLEYWFGWSPTVQDIGSAAMALGVNPVLASVRERGTSGFHIQEVRSISINGNARQHSTVVHGLVRQGAEFRLTNENLFLASRLGLVNPVAIAWELVPFSFVVDWFTKFGSYLEGFTDLAGLQVVRPWSTSFAKIDTVGEYWLTRSPGNRCVCRWRTYNLKRTTSLLRPVPVTPKLVNFGDSVTRAATAVSLLNVLFLKGK